jgi:hypothetical protein
MSNTRDSGQDSQARINRALVEFAEFQRIAAVRRWETIIRFPISPVVYPTNHVPPNPASFVPPVNEPVYFP